jgi:hypothetical protein
MSKYMGLKNSLSSGVLYRILLVVMVAVLVLTVLVQSNPGTVIPNRDYGIFVYIGKQILRGQMPYRDVWDNKPPGIFYLNAAALVIGRGSRWGVWIVECVFLFGAILLSFNLMKKLWGIWPAVFGVLIWLVGLNQTLQGGNFTEEYSLVFHFFALLVFLKLIEEPGNRLYNLLLGLAFSVVFLIRPNNVLVEAILILMLAVIQVVRRNARLFLTHFLWVSLGVLVPILITVAYFWSQGLLRDLWGGAILLNLSYSSTTVSSSSPLVAGFQYLQVAAWMGVLGYVAILFNIKKSFGNPSFFVLIFLLLGWPLAIALSDPAGRNYGHYFMNWLPFIALLSGLALYTLGAKVSAVGRMLEATSPYAFVVALILAVGYLGVCGGLGEYQKAMDRVLNKPDKEIRSPYAVYAENHTRPGEYVLFWAHLLGENYMSNRDAPYSTLPYPTLVESEITKQLNDDFMQDVLSHPPVLIVDMGRLDPLSLDPVIRADQRKHGLGWKFPPDNLEEFFSFVEKNYYLEAQKQGKSIYRLNGTTPP